MTQGEIEKGLREIGLKKGDTILLHSSLSSIGHVEGGADTVVDAFLSVLGLEGTLVVPTFGKLGVIAETVNGRPEAVRSIHPLASVAAIGGNAVEICRDHWKMELAHAEGTPYARVAEMDGYVCLLGVDQDRSTTLHTVEELLRLPYLSPTADIAFSTPEGEIRRSWDYFPGPHRDFIGLDRLLRESGRMRTGKIGAAVVRLIPSRELIEIVRAGGEKNPAFVLCDNPECADCVGQRARIRAHRFSQESFRLAASSALSGRYIAEMIDSLQAAGIGTVEIDYIQGLPWPLHPREKTTAAIQSFRAGGIEVSALRLVSIPPAIDPLLATAAESGINRLVMPLTPSAPEIAVAAQRKNIQVSFFNALLSGQESSAILLDLVKRNLPARFTFHAANFARAGEKPFLESYKRKLRRFVDQLDIEDAAFDGLPRDLARGNAEIKEMISILRCASFPGYFVLGSGNRPLMDLSETVTDFERLIDSM